jgi:hypothetical protein
MIDLYQTHPSGGICEVFYNGQYSTTVISEEIGEFISMYHYWGFAITLHKFSGLTQRKA